MTLPPKAKRHLPALRILFYAVLLLIVCAWGFLLWSYTLQASAKLNIEIVQPDFSAVFDYQTLEQAPVSTKNYELPLGYSLVSQLPKFIKPQDGKLVSKPKKTDLGEYLVVFKPDDVSQPGGRLIWRLQIELQPIDMDKLLADVKASLGSQQDKYAVYIEDFGRKQAASYNTSLKLPPGSISKIPVGILTLRDIDSGQRKFSDTYKINNQLKHSTSDNLGRLPAGTAVTIQRYIEELFTQSNNTAQYHLRVMLGGSYEAVNPRSQKELGIKTFYEDPHLATAWDVAKVFRDIYKAKTLSNEMRDYFFGLLKRAAPSLKSGIPAGVPADISVANKVGFLFGGKEGNVYNDAGIVFGKYTDYLLVVLNKQTTPFPTGSIPIKQLSSIVYKQLDRQ